MASSKCALDILNWAGDFPISHLDNTSAILPTSPKCYIKRSSNDNLFLWPPIQPLTLSHLGLHIPVILMPGLSIRNKDSRRDPIGNYNAAVDISPVSLRYRDRIPTTYSLLDNKISGKDGWKDNRHKYQTTFAVFNFTSARNIISLRKTCIALGLLCNQSAGQVSTSGLFEIIQTNEPIVFYLSSRMEISSDTDEWYWKIQADGLSQHGMQLISLYL